MLSHTSQCAQSYLLKEWCKPEPVLKRHQTVCCNLVPVLQGTEVILITFRFLRGMSLCCILSILFWSYIFHQTLNVKVINFYLFLWSSVIPFLHTRQFFHNTVANLMYFIEIILHHQHDNEDIMMYLKYILDLQHHLQYHTLQYHISMWGWQSPRWINENRYVRIRKPGHAHIQLYFRNPIHRTHVSHLFCYSLALTF